MESAIAENTLPILQSGCKTLGITLTPQQESQLLAYAQLFCKWNKAYNLSAIRDELGIARLHLLDSLSVVPLIQGQRLIDVGTGGGLPGIPLAIMYPERHFTLLDSAGKKMRFLHQVKQSLSIENIDIQNCRVESYKPESLYDGVVSRAYASLTNMIESCRHLLNEGGSFWAMKGQMPHSELSEIEKHYIVVESYSLEVPGVDAQRCLLQLKPR